MVNVTFITVGSLKEEYLKKAVDEYKKRLCAFCKPNIVELKEVKLSDDPSKNEIRLPGVPVQHSSPTAQEAGRESFYGKDMPAAREFPNGCLAGTAAL
jgi:hypothetical protein